MSNQSNSQNAPKSSRTDAVRQALAARGAKAKPKPPPKLPPVAAAATPKKVNPRSAKARDERAKARGRLPLWTTFDAEWQGDTYEGQMSVWDAKGDVVKAFVHKAEGLFRLFEELDVQFWNWFATATEIEKGRLTFEQNPPEPAPFPTPEAPAGKEAASP